MSETLERIVIDPDWRMARFYYGDNRARETGYYRLKEADKRGVLTLLKTSFTANGDPGNDARRDWEERIVGKEGCWAVALNENTGPRRIMAQTRHYEL